MVATPTEPARAAPTAASGRLAGTISILGAMSVRKNRYSLRVYAGLSGAAAAPSVVIASKTLTKPGPFGSVTATLSPRATPTAASCPASLHLAGELGVA